MQILWQLRHDLIIWKEFDIVGSEELNWLLGTVSGYGSILEPGLVDSKWRQASQRQVGLNGS